jgi:hypothetical protein
VSSAPHSRNIHSQCSFFIARDQASRPYKRTGKITPRPSEVVRNLVTIYGEGLLTPRPTTKLEDLPLLAAIASSIYSQLPFLSVGRDSSVGIATRYGLDGPGIESRWGRDFRHPCRPAVGPTQPPVQWVPGLSKGQSGQGVALATHPPSNVEVKERVKLYICYPFGPSLPVVR